MPFDERRPLSIRAWLATPLLFATAVLGLTGLGGVLLDADWWISLSTAVSGPAAAITGLLATGVEWRPPSLRWWAGLGYPVLVFAAGLPLADLSVPPPLAALAGTPALVVLAVLIARERDRVIPIV